MKDDLITNTDVAFSLEKNTGENFKLTKYSHGAGCGCKIAPKILDEIFVKSNYPTLF